MSFWVNRLSSPLVKVVLPVIVVKIGRSLIYVD